MIYYYLDCMHSVWHFGFIHFILILIFIFHFLLMNISGNTKTNVLGSIFGLSASYISCMTRFRKQRCIYPGVLCMYTYQGRYNFEISCQNLEKIFSIQEYPHHLCFWNLLMHEIYEMLRPKIYSKIFVFVFPLKCRQSIKKANTTI